MNVQIKSEQDGSVGYLELEGRLDAASAQPVRDILKSFAEAAQEPRIRVDLSKVSFIDSTGLAALISGLKAIRARNGSLTLEGVRPEVMRVFQVTLLDRVFTFGPAAA
jgi:anti-sigma B factor antagonist